MADVWPEPETFDPLRFTEANSRGRHKYAFVPYGGGAHMCIGLHFAYMQAKCFAYHFLSDIEARSRPAIGRNGSSGRSRSRATGCG